MKIKPEHLEHMRAAIAPLLAKHPEAPAQYKAAGLTPERYRWDVLHAAGLTPWICKNLYSYLNDSHVDTALRAIMPEDGRIE